MTGVIRMVMWEGGGVEGDDSLHRYVMVGVVVTEKPFKKIEGSCVVLETSGNESMELLDVVNAMPTRESRLQGLDASQFIVRMNEV